MSTTGGLPEETRIRFTKQLRRLREEDVQEISFPPTLTNVERMFLHNLAKELGLLSKSQGKGEQRFITVSKRQEVTAESTSLKKKIEISVDPGVQRALQQHLDAFPEVPKVELQACAPPARHRPKPVDPERMQIIHSRAQEARRQHQDYDKLQANRQRLPAKNYEAEVCELIQNHQIILISGETGCGKTTQVPQFILDHPDMGPTARVVVTQPRRISAISVAERIAEERSEGIGGTIGYNIRLDRSESESTQVLFVTPGLLLRKLESDPLLDAHTHIIIDEAHERDRFTEFIMIVMKDILPQRPDLRLILMSATLQTAKLADYFGGCPQLQIGSSMFPVQEYFLEDVLRLTDYVTDADAPEFQIQVQAFTCALCGRGGFKLPTELGAHMALCFGSAKPTKAAAPKLTSNVLEQLQQAAKVADDSSPSPSTPSRADDAVDEDEMDDLHSVATVESDAASLVGVEVISSPTKAAAPEEQESDRILDQYMKQVQDESVDLELIEALLEHIFSKDFDMKGSVLVFLPGWDDISRLGKQLRLSGIFSNPNRYRILPLHSGIPKSRQKEVFQAVPEGCYKIVLSTNIAETSITIDDIVVVIDGGRVKEQSYDPHTKLALLQPQWISQSSARQRKGRAGRTRAGVCFHLFSRRRHASLPVQQDSELLRMPLEEVCLQAKSLGVAGRSSTTDQTGELLTFLSNAMDAPHPLAISNACDALKHIGCLTEQEQITPMGVMLSKFSMHPRLGWMVLLGVLCGCPTAAVSAACAVAGRDPFVVPMDPVQKRQAMTAKVTLSGGHRSDQFALVSALTAFNMFRQRVGFKELVKFCDDQFLSMSSLTMFADTVQQTVREVKDLHIQAAQHPKNDNDHSLLVALISVGLYPNHAVRSRGQTHWFTEHEQRARIHTGSVNNISAANLRTKCTESIQILAYQNLIENKTGMRFASANLTMLSTTPMPVLLLILIADEIREATPQEQSEELSADQTAAALQPIAAAVEAKKADDNGDDVWEEALESAAAAPELPPVDMVQLRVDGWLMLSCPRSDWVMLEELRSRVKSALAHLCVFPSQPLPVALRHAMDTLVQLIRESQAPPLNVANPSVGMGSEDSSGYGGYGGGRGRGGYSRGGGRGGRGASGNTYEGRGGNGNGRGRGNGRHSNSGGGRGNSRPNDHNDGGRGGGRSGYRGRGSRGGRGSNHA